MTNPDRSPRAVSDDVALFQREPALARTLPRLPLGRFPTPVERLTLETAEGRRTLLVKRDDLCAEGYAGNKVRKLEFLLADARARGATRLITAGAAGSHHAFATAYHGRSLGFDATLVLFPQSLTPHVRVMLMLDHAAGAELCWASRMEAVPYGVWRARLAHRGEATYIVPPGGSNAVGTLGYVNGGLELAAQIERGEVERPAEIHVAAGTLGTLAGIAIGLAWAGLRIPVLGTRITSRIVTNERVLGTLVRGALEVLRTAGASTLPSAEDALRLATLHHEQIGAGYGRATDAGAAAAASFAEAGLALDSTYTAKAAATLLARPPAGRGEPLFWHTLSAITPGELLAHTDGDALPPSFVRYLATG